VPVAAYLLVIARDVPCHCPHIARDFQNKYQPAWQSGLDAQDAPGLYAKPACTALLGTLWYSWYFEHLYVSKHALDIARRKLDLDILCHPGRWRKVLRVFCIQNNLMRTLKSQLFKKPALIRAGLAWNPLAVWCGWRAVAIGPRIICFVLCLFGKLPSSNGPKPAEMNHRLSPHAR
jgi:hypothetical protein